MSKPLAASGAIAPRLSARAATSAAPLISLPLALGLLTYVLGLTSTQQRLDDPDAMLHVVIGNWVLAHGAVPHVDYFSYTFAGKPWVAHEWLGGVVSALVFDTLGWHGLVAMASFGLAATVAYLTRALLRYYTPAQAVVIACAAWMVVTPHWLARPHILALPFLAIWLDWLVAARVAGRAPPLACALLMTLWVNIHGTFLVGIGFTGLFAVEAVLMTRGEGPRIKAAKAWAIFTLAAIAASLVTPNLLEAYLLPLRLLDMTFALSMLLEWKSIDFQHLSPIELWLLLFIGACLLRGVRLSATRVGMVLLLFVMSLQHARNGDLIAIIAPLLAGPAAGPQLAPKQPQSDWLASFAQPARRAGLAIAFAVLVLAEAVAFAFPVGPVAKYAPEAAVQAVQQAGITGPVLNDYNYGDYLMLSGIKTYIDGRADMYGDPFLKYYYEAVRGITDNLPKLLADNYVAWTIFPAGSRAVELLDHMAGWHRLHSDAIAVVHVRDGAR